MDESRHFLSEVLAFMFVYNVEIIVLHAFRASDIYFLPLSRLVSFFFYVTGFSLITQEPKTDPSAPLMLLSVF